MSIHYFIIFPCHNDTTWADYWQLDTKTSFLYNYPMTKATPLMIQGTASGVGKTVLTMALCKIFNEDGYRVSPFKSQNITSNTAFTKNDDEIALSQMLQAWAAGAEPNVAMNPLVLKPLPEKRAWRIILNGKHYGDVSPAEFVKIKPGLIQEVTNSYNELANKSDIVVIEGAGSPAELNLNRDDIANMGMAKAANAPVILVADIDRGGVFASLYGTVNLLTESERKHIKATIVNRFKGDASSFADGVSIIEEFTALPVLGVVPHILLDIPEEDALFGSNNDSYQENRDLADQFDLIAKTVRESLDMELLYRILKGGMEC